MGGSGVAGLAFIGAERGLGVRATPSRRGRAAALGLGEESRPVPSSGMTGGSPRVRERKRKERPALTGPRDGRREGNGPAGNGLARSFLGRGERKRKGEWAGLKE